MIKVVYLAGGYPSEDNPSHGIFNKRAVTSLQHLTDLTLIHFRIYKPGRSFYGEETIDRHKKITLCIPFIPVLDHYFFRLNHFIFRIFLQLFCSNYLKTCDLVHASDGTLGVMISPLTKRYDFKLLTQFIGGDLNQDLTKHKGKRWLLNRLGRVDAFTFNSHTLMKTFYEQVTPTQNQVCRVVYRGVDTRKFKPIKKTYKNLNFYFLGGLPNYLNFKHGRNTKGGRTLMEAWIGCEKEAFEKQAKLFFAGPDSDIMEVDNWKKSLQYPQLVEIVGKVSPDKIVDFHNSGNVIIIPSLEEGLPNAMMEGLACGNIPIATNVGGIPEVLNGLDIDLIESNSVEMLRKRILQILNSPENELEELSKRCRHYIEEKFDSSSFSINYLELYKQIATCR